jgi:hypothetical protein
MSATEVTPAKQVTCRRCRRPLYSASSRILGVGPRCAAIEAATEGLSAKQVDKMKQVIIDGGVQPTSRPEVWRITNEAGTATHIAHVNGNCTCEFGLRRKSGLAKVCYGVAAARLMYRPQIRRVLRRSQFGKAA